ncbi:MAG TPA: hypothetical protein VE173_05320, partial [Longimicrobiales bacterium]|nr:hypothetical protein [Longimicrobiales bacterium]
RVVGMSRLPDQAESSHVDVNQSASGQATSSSVECGSSRLDDPAGSYEFTNLKISPSGEREVAVAFNYLWRGEAEPVPQTCTVEVRDGAGVGLGETRFNFLALDAVGDSAVPGTTTTHVGLDEAFSQAEQLAARVECNSL